MLLSREVFVNEKPFVEGSACSEDGTMACKCMCGMCVIKISIRTCMFICMEYAGVGVYICVSICIHIHLPSL